MIKCNLHEGKVFSVFKFKYKIYTEKKIQEIVLCLFKTRVQQIHGTMPYYTNN